MTNEFYDGKLIVGKCPVCGKPVVETTSGFLCTGMDENGKRCSFAVKRNVHGAVITPEICKQLLANGRTSAIEMVNKNGQPFLADLTVLNGQVVLELESHFLLGRCPKCGGRVKKTCKGYACEHHVDEGSECGFNLSGFICNRKITEEEAEEFLAGHRVVLDGFSSNDGKVFSSTLVLNDDGSVSLESRITTCPVCGAPVHVGTKAYNCRNYSNRSHHCGFSIWRNISGHSVTPEEARQICEEGQTREPLEMFKDDGTVYYKRLALGGNHNEQIVKI